jgi:creatinine amidohydrolase/Fe(II)-dependent formamide hydrolase-like protein
MSARTDKIKDPLKILQVIDKLEVGPVSIEPNRIICPYVVRRGKKTDKTDLICRYEEPVFQDVDESVINLASMITAQVALNYGLFCNKIIFHGIFGNPDRRFLQDMLDNTSREIYVKKFLQENPFLTQEVHNLPAVRRKKYTHAEISFVSRETKTPFPKWALWETNKSHVAILSSGGKDSLLSYGVLKETGQIAHPVFINESGRHWYTALNAYRYFRENIPNTARVWTNADRVFTWMLRHLPFIKQNFAEIRADIYPIRLWTVAVFIFGALPLLRQRGIGRLVIGDEYDTTVRSTYKGITHYDGLYDQSRYFDNYLSRYFLAKGWSIIQFSILRPLSELLILKILTERYPHLQVHQMSCHAAHIQGETVLPCGKCEKCRRIIAMLTALGADPKQCGYKPEQIDESLKTIAIKRLHQEADGQKHLVYLLGQKGIIKSDQSISARPEVLNLRIDKERSPLSAIPQDLRRKVYGIYLEHAQGSVRHDDRKWESFDLMEDDMLSEPYPFETVYLTRDISGGKKKKMEKKGEYLFGQLTWPEAEAYLKKVDVALLPVGAIEQHGPHLPLDTDAFDADYLAKQVAAACSEPRPVVLPLIPYGVSYHHDDFKGTISINNDTMSQLVYEIGISAARNGIKKLLIINGHGGNSPSLNFAAQMINRDSRIFVAVDTGETSDVDIYKIVETPNDVHAGEFETSTSLAVRPELVRMDKAEKSVPQFSSRYLNFTSKRGISWYAYTKRISETGVMGDPTKATAEKGEKMWQIMIAHLVALVEDLKRMTIREIHERRY